MRVEDIVKSIKDRQTAMEKSVFSNNSTFKEIDFAKQQGRWMGLADALAIISEAIKKENNED